MKINRVWEMPNSRTFQIKAIKTIIEKYSHGVVIDPFANSNKLATITNDLDEQQETDYHMDATDFLSMFDSESVDVLADYLIAHGVTVQECGHWVSYQSDEPYGCMDDKEWYRCSKCGKDAHGRCYEDEWYSAPILSSHCPHCGAKMMPQPPKGE